MIAQAGCSARPHYSNAGSSDHVDSRIAVHEGIDYPAKHFQNKKIQATGTVKDVDSVPRIEVNESKQIRIVERKPAET